MDESKAKRLTTFDNLDQEIIDLSEELVIKHKKKLVDVPIYLSLYRHGSVDLTLIDLPGLTYENNMAE